MGNPLRHLLGWLRALSPAAQRRLRAGSLLALAALLARRLLLRRRASATAAAAAALRAVPYSQFLADAAAGDVADAVVGQGGALLSYTSKTRPGRFVAQRVALPHAVVGVLQKSGATFRAAPPQRSWGQVVIAALPLIYIAAMGGVLYKFYRDSVGDVGKPAGQRRRRRGGGDGDGPAGLGFDDVAGCAAAKASVQEVVDVLRSPERYQAMGARQPRGLLLVGPPGTGKTLLAKCVANEADVPFFYCSGSEFVEIFAGRGASRVRGLFKRARAAARASGGAIVFIDELDALGKRRSGDFTSNEERDQTLNELLTAMDGFHGGGGGGDGSDRVVVIGATNRYGVLDEALCRPGRFDRVIRVELPDAAGRAAILRVHLRRVPCGAGLDVTAVAQATEGYSGAELANLVNEAAIRAVREDCRQVTTAHMLGAARELDISCGRAVGGARKVGGAGAGGRGVPLPDMYALMQSLGMSGPGRAGVA